MANAIIDGQRQYMAGGSLSVSYHGPGAYHEGFRFSVSLPTDKFSRGTKKSLKVLFTLSEMEEIVNWWQQSKQNYPEHFRDK